MAYQQMRYRNARGRAIRLVEAARVRARKKGLPFSLRVDDIQAAITHGRCQCTGLPFNLDADIDGKYHAPFAPSLDRRDPSKGYTKGNVRIVVSAFNFARNAWGDQVFELVARAYIERNRA